MKHRTRRRFPLTGTHSLRAAYGICGVKPEKISEVNERNYRLNPTHPRVERFCKKYNWHIADFALRV